MPRVADKNIDLYLFLNKYLKKNIKHVLYDVEYFAGRYFYTKRVRLLSIYLLV